MSLINQKVTHDVYGQGIITNLNDSYIEISFSSQPTGVKKFIFPDALGIHLKPVEQKTTDLISKIKQQGRKREQAEKELRHKKLQLRLKQEQRARQAIARRVHPASQSVFWCTPEEESRIFINWEISTGTIQSGSRKGQPRNLARLDQNSACLLTAREPDEPEAARRILGLFMINQLSNLKGNRDGYIRAHSRYRLQLPEQVTEKILFWNYYINEKSPDKISWNTGRQRYFDNILIAQILRDILALTDEPLGQKRTRDFFEHFCKMNNFTTDEIAKPNGALMQVKTE